MPSARAKILRMFPRGTEVLAVYNNYSEDEYISILNAIEGSIPFSKPEHNRSLCLFLYSGCLKFLRWSAPSPFIVNSDLSAKFRRFVNALIRAERGISDNTKTFLLYDIKNDLFLEFDTISLNEIDLEKVQAFHERVNNIPNPVNGVKVQEFASAKNKIQTLLNGISSKTIRTRIGTQLPFIIHLQPLVIEFIWQGISTRATFDPSFEPREIFATIQPTAQPVGPSRWQAGITTISLEFMAIVDGDKRTPSLLEFDAHEIPFDGWPKAFAIAFNLIYDLTWHIRVRYTGEQQWIPAPRDLANIEWEIFTTEHRQIEWKLKSSPAALFKGFEPQNEVLQIDLGEISSLEWHTKCRSLAKMYMEVGETNEALFWLNAGVEALFKKRFEIISQKVGKPELLNELDSPKAFWDSAEEVVIQQFPEMAGKIQWPQAQIHVSVYSKIKYLYKQVTMRTSVKELLSHYSTVSKHRNALFHGTTEQRLPVDTVKEAMASFDWIEENCALATTS